MVRIRYEFLVLIFLGLVMVASSAQLLWGLTTPERGLVATITEGSHYWSWWASVGIPFPEGLIYLLVGAWGLMTALSIRTVMAVLFGCLIVAIVMNLIIGGFGLPASILCTLALLVAVLNYRKQLF